MSSSSFKFGSKWDKLEQPFDRMSLILKWNFIFILKKLILSPWCPSQLNCLHEKIPKKITLNQAYLKLSSVGTMPLLCNAEVASASMTMAPPACWQQQKKIEKEAEKKKGCLKNNKKLRHGKETFKQIRYLCLSTSGSLSCSFHSTIETFEINN